MGVAPWLGGQRVTAERLAELQDKWSNFTPAWTASTTNPTLGNGSLTSRYCRSGDFVKYAGYLQCGSTTNGGTGIWAMSLPIPAASVGIVYVSSAEYVNLGDNEYIGVCRITSGGSSVLFTVKTNVSSKSFDLVSNTVPVGTTANSQLSWFMLYEAA